MLDAMVSYLRQIDGLLDAVNERDKRIDLAMQAIIHDKDIPSDTSVKLLMILDGSVKPAGVLH